MKTKIDGKFYPLQHDEWLRACQELTSAQKDILYYIRTLDPYSDGVELSPAEIARSLSTESKTVHRSTVGRALKVLDQKGYINMELLKVKVRVLGKGLHCCLEATMLPPGNMSDRDATRLPPDNMSDRDATRESPQRPTNLDSHPPIKTYSDFKKTLSESERENFKFFCKRRAEQYDKPVVLLDKWIEKNFEELYEEYQRVHGKDKFSGGAVSPPKNDPELEKAIACALQAKKEGKIRDLYWSSKYNCDCVVLLQGEIVPVVEWCLEFEPEGKGEVDEL